MSEIEKLSEAWVCNGHVFQTEEEARAHEMRNRAAKLVLKNRRGLVYDAHVVNGIMEVAELEPEAVERFLQARGV